MRRRTARAELFALPDAEVFVAAPCAPPKVGVDILLGEGAEGVEAVDLRHGLQVESPCALGVAPERVLSANAKGRVEYVHHLVEHLLVPVDSTPDAPWQSSCSPLREDVFRLRRARRGLVRCVHDEEVTRGKNRGSVGVARGEWDVVELEGVWLRRSLEGGRRPDAIENKGRRIGQVWNGSKFGTLKVWNGSKFGTAQSLERLKAWNGSKLGTAQSLERLKVWNGSKFGTAMNTRKG